MSDVVVTVPMNFTHECAPGKRGLAAWIEEGDAAGDAWSGTEWAFSIGRNRPRIVPGERVYIVCNRWVRGYAPLIRIDEDCGVVELIRGPGAVAVTVPKRITGFRGFRYRWWEYVDEVPFPEWKIDYPV